MKNFWKKFELKKLNEYVCEQNFIENILFERRQNFFTILIYQCKILSIDKIKQMV